MGGRSGPTSRGTMDANQVRTAYLRLAEAHQKKPYPSAAERIDRLERLERVLSGRRQDFQRAIHQDFGGRASQETDLADVLVTLDSVRDARRHVESWMQRRPARPNTYFQPSRAVIEVLPKGVVGIISPWNYPVNLALAPLAAAFAAGNRAILKPSELTPRTAALLGEALRDHFSADELAVLEGGPEVARALTELPLDHLFFTGSTGVGRKVASAAANNLVPTTLELGGKSPALVEESYPIARAAERIALGKAFNAGQTCIAPDYVLVKKGSEVAFAEAFFETLRGAYPNLLENPQYSSVVSDAHHQRLLALAKDATERGAEVQSPLGALENTAGTRRMAPALVLGTTAEMRIMQEEIFGPLLPLRTYEHIDQALAEIAARPHPLAFYYFDEDLSRADRVLERTISGGATINDTLVHFAQEELPFGGVGQSGMGAYHGQAGFLAFSHTRGVFVASPYSPARRLLSPPYGRILERVLDVMIAGILPTVGAVRRALRR
ncbi:MAG: coniferyl aldehyde dehydrogenase [Myxococcota bacterium]